MTIEVPPAVAAKARVSGAVAWLNSLPALVAQLEHEWNIAVGTPYLGGTEAYVAQAVRADGSAAVLKLLVPRDARVTAGELTVLRLADGQGCARLLRCDPARDALLLERLGPSMADLGLPLRPRQDVLCDLAARVWRPAPDCGLPDGAQKAADLADYITATWAALDRPCSERAVEHALACAARRGRAHDPERARLLHGDVHQWNALRSGDGFALVDPDGLLAEPEYDLGVLMREDPVELMQGDPRTRAHRLAQRAGCDPSAVWEWGVVERVSTGLVATSIDLQPVGRQMLAAADRIARDLPGPC